MSLRDTLRATIAGQVACCTPQQTQRATPGTDGATARATDAQHLAASPRAYTLSGATGNATSAQQESCAGLGSALVAAINRCCDARGDTEANRQGLIAESLLQSPEHQADLLAHFYIEAARNGEGGSV